MSYQLIIVIRDNTLPDGAAIPGATATCSGGTAVADPVSGVAYLSVAGFTIGQLISITAYAPGFVTQTAVLTVTQYTGSLTFSLAPLADASSVQQTFYVKDTSENPVAGAQVFLNGGSSVTTDANGLVSLSFKAGANQVQVTAPGFNVLKSTFQSIYTSPTVFLTPLNDTGQIISLLANPPGATVQIGGEIGQSGSDGVYKTTAAYTAGTYSVTSTMGAASSTTLIVVSPAVSVYDLLPVATPDAASGSASQSLSPTGAAAPSSSSPGTLPQTNTVTATPSLTPDGAGVTTPQSDLVPDYEFINPTGGFGRYFTATQARMYIGNLFIEELAGVQFVLQGNQVPIFGYASEAFDALGSGKTLVQGQIMLHFISEGYLYTVLNEYEKSASAGNSSSSQAFANLMQTQQELQATKSPSASVTAQIASIQAQRTAMLAQDPTLSQTYKRTLAAATTAAGPNAVYRKTPFDIVLELEGGGRTVTRRISNCVITSNEQIYGDSDSPLLDSYGFIGRSLK